MKPRAFPKRLTPENLGYTVDYDNLGLKGSYSTTRSQLRQRLCESPVVLQILCGRRGYAGTADHRRQACDP